MSLKEVLEKIYGSGQTVWTSKELASLFKEDNPLRLRDRLKYYARRGYLKRLRRGIYAVKENYNSFEYATKIYVPSYVSFETVLFMSGVIFQPSYDTIYVASYLSREVKTNEFSTRFRKIKEEILVNPKGLKYIEFYWRAEPERAYLDCLYVYKEFYVDNPKLLNKKRLSELCNIYKGKEGLLKKKVKQL